MPLSRKAIEEFKEIYRKETGQEISDEEARDIAEGLFFFFKLICRPLPKKEKGKENRGASRFSGEGY